jgi:hypothetical protein
LDSYAVKGYITGIAKATFCILTTSPYFLTLTILSLITIENLKEVPNSFMGQLVPDGIKVVLKIFHKDLLISTLQETAQRVR